MNFSSFSYLVKQGWRNMIANRLMTVASCGVLSACLVITGIAALVSANINSFMEDLGSRTAVEAFLSPDIDDTILSQAEAGIVAIGDMVKEYKYISKEQAVTEMMEYMGDYGGLLEGMSGEDNPENPLPASFRVTVAKAEDVGSVAEKLRVLPGVANIKSPSELSALLANMQKTINVAGWSLVAVLGVVSVVVISNTIRLTVFARRKEINIMKFVGATNTFIRMPFFVEGVTVGTVSGLLASVVVLCAYSLLLRYFATPDAISLAFFTPSILPIKAVWGYVLGGFLAFGAVLGSVGTTSSIRKHLKV